MVDQRKLFYAILDNEWSYFWASSHVEQPRIKGHFLKYVEEFFRIVDGTDEERFKSIIEMKHPHQAHKSKDVTYYEFEDYIPHLIVKHIERGVTNYEYR